MLTRRQFIGAGVVAAASGAAGAVALVADAEEAAAARRQSKDYSARFAKYDVADEPDGDLTKVVWPAFVINAGPEVKRLYEFQITNGSIMRYMPCFCGCGQHAGHRNNRDCYVRSVDADGTVALDSMAPT